MSDESSFEVIPIAIGEYRHHAGLAGIDEQVARIVTAFGRLGGVERAWDAPQAERTTSAVQARLNEWVDAEAPRSSILFWTGHGESNGDDAWLAAHDTPDPIAHRGINVTTVADTIIAEWHRRGLDERAWTIVVIDACGAGTFVRRLGAALYSRTDVPERLALIGVGGDGASHLGEFARVLAKTLASYNDNDERVGVPDLVGRIENRIAHDERLGVQDLVGRLQRHILEGRVIPLDLHKAAALRRRRVLSETTAPVDVYRELTEFLGALPADQRAHFVPKAQGAEHGELAWYFVGRVGEQQRILSWLRESASGMLIVSGRAGAGKSALLGNVLVHTNAELRDLLIRARAWEPVTDAAPAAPDVVVHLTGLTASEVIRKLAGAAGLEKPAAVDTGGEADWLVETLRSERIALTVFADALDEAQEPVTIARSVLRRLADLPLGTVVVGTRASTKEGPDQQTPADEDLLDALGRGTGTELVWVDRDPVAIAEYVRRRLIAGRPDFTESTVDNVAEIIRRQDRQFLFARLAVHEILQRPDLLDDEEELLHVIGHDHRVLFGAAVNRLTAGFAAAEPLLQALALARGRGLPRADLIWVTVAGALSYTPVTENDIDELLETAAPYVMLDAEDGQATYRLAHQTFVEHFRPWQDAPGHWQATKVLVGLGRRNGWPVANRYLVRRLPEHAQLGEAMDLLLAAEDALDHFDQHALGNAVVATSFGWPNASLTARAVIRTRHLLPETPVDTRPAVRGFARMIDGATVPPMRATRSDWWPRWTHTGFSSSHLTLAGHGSGIAELVAVGPVLAVRSRAGRVRLWDPRNGALLDELPGTVDRVAVALAVVEHLGQSLLAVGYGNGVVALYDPVACREVREMPQAGETRLSGLIAMPEGRVVTADPAGTVRLLDLVSGAELGRYQAEGKVLLAPMRLTGRPTAVAIGTESGVVRLWEPDSGDVTEVVFDEHESELTSRGQGPVTALTTVPGRGGDVLVARRLHGSIRAWQPSESKDYRWSLGERTDAIAGTESGLLLVGSGPALWLCDPRLPPAEARNGEVSTGRSNRIEVVACVTTATSTTVLVSADEGGDGTVRIWSPALASGAGRRAAHGTEGAGPVGHLAVLGSTGAEFVATAHEDTTANLWRLSTGERHSSLAAEAVDGVGSLSTVIGSDGRELLVAGQYERVTLRDPATGAIARTFECPGMGLITALAAVPLSTLDSGGPGSTLLAVGSGFGGDRTIRLWNVDTGTPHGYPLPTAHNKGIESLTAVRLPDGRTILVSGDVQGRTQAWDPVKAEVVGEHPFGSPAFPLAAVPLPGHRDFLAITDVPGNLALVDYATGSSIAYGFKAACSAVFSRPDGQTVLAAGGSSGTVRFWRLDDEARGTPMFSIPLMTPINALAAAPGPTLVAGTEAGVIVVDLAGFETGRGY
ncbi:hypothetical protein [Amycolatopsis sp. NPDC051071]|uniref:hypothetical protein n=1 Tax=Amycolatopsis sp. NPDC051071 TaxID=3154637 RepID=UPI00341C1DED